MNNNQIVESVASGIRSVIRKDLPRILRAELASGKTLIINNQLDGDAIGKQVIKYHNGKVKQTGISPLSAPGSRTNLPNYPSPLQAA